MRAVLLAAVAVLASGQAHAAVISFTQTVNASAPALRADNVRYTFTPFDAALGTLTSAQVTFTGLLDTGTQLVRTFVDDPDPTTAVLASQVEVIFAGTSARQTLPAQTRSVRGGQTTGEIARFDLSAAVPLTPSFVSDPTFLVRAFTLVNRTNGTPFERPSDFDPTSLRGGSLTLAYTYTAAATAVPEPVSLSLLTLGLAGLAVARRRQTA